MRTKSLLLLTRSSFLMLLLSLGTASAGDTTDPDPVGLPAAAPCNFIECTHEIQPCGSVCGWLFNGTVRSLSLAPRLDNSLVDIALAKQPDIQAALKEPPRSKDAANGNVRISYMTTAAEGAEPSGSETIKPSAETPEPHWSHLPIWGAEAEARGHRIPLPFGIGATFYDARQPVNVRDLKLGAGNGRSGVVPVRESQGSDYLVAAERLDQDRCMAIPIFQHIRHCRVHQGKYQRHRDRYRSGARTFKPGSTAVCRIPRSDRGWGHDPCRWF